MSVFRNSCLYISAAVLAACSQESIAPPEAESPALDINAASPALDINFEKITLDNGLDVIFHIDRSDPVVAIDLAAHVGSGREVTGRTGFAHLFEHLLFLDSENLGYGGLDEMNTRIGGEGTNGFTTNDMTQYFQAVPKDALEKIIWAEADKLGWFINTVSQDVVDNEKQVVKNEKRQRVDNQPYGHNLYIISKALYPEGHPYNWQVIGSLTDLDAASLQDVKDFYAKWYVPNNVTVTISGDFDKAVAKKMVEKYFGEIPRGDDIPAYDARPGTLTKSLSFYHEDNFATVPQLSLTWPAVEQYHPDAYALDMLISYLTEGKRAPLNEVMIDEDKVTSAVSGFNFTKEIAGEIYLFISPNEGEDIDGLIPSLRKAFTRFEDNGISQADLDRIKAGIEVDFYGEVQSALGKAIQLGEYNVFTGDPGFYKKDIANIQAVTPDDLMRVYQSYMKDKPHIAVSFTPKGALDLALDGAVKADVVEEKIVAGEGAAPNFDPTARVLAVTTPSAFDRTIEPEFGGAYDLPSPDIWRDKLGNGMQVYGIRSDETPLINFSLKVDAGRQYGSVDKPAIAALTADMLEKGTAHKTTAELEDAIKSLGSSISISNGASGTFISGTTLRRNFDQTVQLVTEMLTKPRWDAEEFALLKAKTLQNITLAEANPNAISARENAKLNYPSDNIFHYTSYGPKEKLEAVTLDDLKAFHNAYYRMDHAKLRIVGDYSPGNVKTQFGSIKQDGNEDGKDNIRTVPGPSKPITESKIYLYDVPGAKQSVLRIERPSLPATAPDFALAEAINFPLGGIYTSKLNTALRVEKGYTYGIRSGFNGDLDRGTFSVRSSVRTNVTKESIDLVREILENYGTEFTQEELDIMKGALLKGQALKNETLSDKLRMLGEISAYDYPVDYRAKNAKAIEAMTLEDFKTLADKYLRPDAMNYLIVGDAATQSEGLKALGYGEPILLNRTK